MLCGVPVRQLNYLNHTQSFQKITVGQYILKSLIYKDVNRAFGHKNDMNSQIFKITEKHNEFNLILNNHEQLAGYSALTYSRLTNNLGVIINNSPYHLSKIYEPIRVAKINKHPLLIISCYDNKHDLSDSAFPELIKSITKRTITIDKINKNISRDFEGLLQYSFGDPAGPVHLNIANSILNKPLKI